MRIRDRLHSVWNQQKHAIALLGMFAAIGVFVMLFVELVRADELVIDTARSLAELDAEWNRAQLQTRISDTSVVASIHLRYFKREAFRLLEGSQLYSLAETSREVAAIVSTLEKDIHSLTPLMVSRAAEQPLGTDLIDRHILALQSWMERFITGQERAFRILLYLYGVLLLVSVGIAMLFARDLWFSERQGFENRLLAQRVIRAQEDERARIAADLHDDVAQSIASAAMIASRLADDFGHHSHLERLQAALDESLSTIRTLSRDLGVPGLRSLPLSQALDRLVAERADGLEVEASYENVGEAFLSVEQKLHLYRIVQECLTNTVRHAEAEHVRLRLVYTHPNVMLRYGDDGHGFNPSRLGGSEPRIGLRGMYERARMLGGELAVTSRPGKGTQVTLVIPVETGTRD